MTKDELNKLLQDMRVNAVWTHQVTMPIPLYERIKEAIKDCRDSL